MSVGNGVCLWVSMEKPSLENLPVNLNILTMYIGFFKALFFTTFYFSLFLKGTQEVAINIKSLAKTH